MAKVSSTIDQCKVYAYITTINYVHTRISKLTYTSLRTIYKARGIVPLPFHVNCMTH